MSTFQIHATNPLTKLLSAFCTIFFFERKMQINLIIQKNVVEDLMDWQWEGSQWIEIARVWHWKVRIVKVWNLWGSWTCWSKIFKASNIGSIKKPHAKSIRMQKKHRNSQETKKCIWVFKYKWNVCCPKCGCILIEDILPHELYIN